ncbi:MAG TPA: hypothetical protein VEG60_27065 [Candidatus Binatia bacterium]|nr:hypothetical protein [Candidatus Binatia bacterium]
MIVEGLSMRAALKEKLKPIIALKVTGKTGHHFGICSIWDYRR